MTRFWTAESRGTWTCLQIKQLLSERFRGAVREESLEWERLQDTQANQNRRGGNRKQIEVMKIFTHTGFRRLDWQC